ncbi:MAG: hypothetical protein ACTSWY_06315 [Promethearchaeota archaeon]
MKNKVICVYCKKKNEKGGASVEPDNVPSFETVITNNTLMRHYGMEVPDELSKMGLENKDYANC